MLKAAPLQTDFPVVNSDAFILDAAWINIDWFTIAACTLYAAVVAWNFKEFRK